MKKDKTRRTNITMPDSLWKLAKKRAFVLHFGDNLSAYLAHLVRKDVDEAADGPDATKRNLSAAS